MKSSIVILSGAIALASTSCYQPRALDSRAVLQELRAEESAATLNSRRQSGTANAQPPRAGEVTADQAVALALQWNPDLRMLRHEAGMAEGEIAAASVFKNPTLDLQVLHVQNLPDRAWAVELGWDPPQPGTRPARVAAARAQREVATDEIAESQLQLEMSVRAAHALVLSYSEQRAIVEQALETRRRIAALVQQRVAGGVGTRLDVSLAMLAVSQVERERDELVAKEIQAGRQLAELVGAHGPLRAAGELPPDAPVPTGVDAMEESALKARPAVLAVQARYEQAEQTVRLEHARRWPELRLMGRYRSNETTANPDDFMLGMRLSLPFLDQNRGPIRISEEARDRERERMRKVLVSIRREIAAALDELALREQSLRRFRETVLPSLSGHEQLLGTAAAGGQIDLVAVLTAQDISLRARREYCELRLAYHRARLALERAIGRHAAHEQHDGESR